MIDARLQGQRFWEVVAKIAFAGGVLALVIYSVGAGEGLRDILILSSSLVGIGGAASSFGALPGFLFGIPRFKGDEGVPFKTGVEAISAQQLTRFIPNTNLEQVSDWLTKIIIGATLVQVAVLPPRFERLCLWIERQLGFADVGVSVVVGATIIFFGVIGFLWGYLWSSIRIMNEMRAMIAED